MEVGRCKLFLPSGKISRTRQNNQRRQVEFLSLSNRTGYCRQATQRRRTSRKGASGEAKSQVCKALERKPLFIALTLNNGLPAQRKFAVNGTDAFSEAICCLVKFLTASGFYFRLFEISWVVREWSNIPYVRSMIVAPAQSGE